MLIASLLFGISASLDALFVGISYGLRKVRIRFWQNLAISLVTLLGTCLSMGLGQEVAAFMPEIVRRCAGSFILILLGLYYIVKWLKTWISHPRHIASDANVFSPSGGVTASPFKPLPLKVPELFSLSLLLSLNNLSAGFSASLTGLPMDCTAASTFLCSVLFLFGGNRLGGNPLLQLAGAVADPLSGMFLVGLGVVQLFF